MNRERVESSNIKSIGHDPEQSILEVEYKSGGIYQYTDVPVDTYQELLAAESKGKYINRHIKGSFEEKRV